MIAVDTSILAYAVNRHAPEHPRAARVVEELVNGELPWALPWSVVHEFLRFVTHPHVAPRPLRPSDAWGFVGQLIASPTARTLAPTERHDQVLVEVMGMVSADRGLPASLETVILLREHGIRELLSADKGMRRFPFLTVRDPLRGEPWTPNAPPLRRYRILKSLPT
jgi:toxin-antitoxin system PIN domain toxin